MLNISFIFLSIEMCSIATILLLRKLFNSADVNYGYLIVVLHFIMSILIYYFRDWNIYLYNRYSSNNVMSMISIIIVGLGFFVISLNRLGLGGYFN